MGKTAKTTVTRYKIPRGTTTPQLSSTSAPPAAVVYNEVGDKRSKKHKPHKHKKDVITETVVDREYIRRPGSSTMIPVSSTSSTQSFTVPRGSRDYDKYRTLPPKPSWTVGSGGGYGGGDDFYRQRPAKESRRSTTAATTGSYGHQPQSGGPRPQPTYASTAIVEEPYEPLVASASQKQLMLEDADRVPETRRLTY